LNWNRIVPGTIRSVLRKQAPVIRSNGEFIRDYFYIEDAAAAYLLLAEKLYQNKELHGMAFNFSSEAPISVTGIVELILQLTKSDMKPVILNEAANEIPEQFLTSRKAHDLLGWQPQFSVREGLKRTIAWYEEYFTRG